MKKINIVVDVMGKMFETCVDEKIFYPGNDPKLTLILTLSLTLGLGLGLNPNPNPKLNPWVRVGVNSCENDKR